MHEFCLYIRDVEDVEVIV